jgi:DHA1 family tetracycline resistance protein-like MFS transporter
VNGSKGRLGVIFFTVLIDLIGFGIVIPILPYYAQRFGQHGLGFGLLVGAFSGMQFISTTVLGRLSDRWGRRPLLLVTMLLNAVGYVGFAYAGSYGVLLVARLVSGFAGGNISVAQAYVADITTAEGRSKGMGMIGAAFGLGFIIGPAIGGFSSHFWGHAAPGLVAAGLSLINLALAWKILPESLHEHHRSNRSMFEFGHFGAAFAHPELRWLLVVWFVAPVAFAGYTVVLPLYASAAFGWKELQLGYLFIVIGVVAAIVQGLVYGRLAGRTGDRALLIAGMFGMAAGILVVPFAGSSGALYGWTVLLAFSNSIFGPAASGMTSVLADPREQGTILGVAQSLAALGRLSGPEVLGTTYDKGGALLAFGIAAAIMALGGLAAMAVPKKGSARVPVHALPNVETQT